MAAPFALTLDGAVLGVGRSLLGRRWVSRLSAEADRAALAIAQRTGVPDLVARMVAARGVGPEDARAFLAPTLRDLMPDPSTLLDMDAAAERLAEAIRRRETLAIVCDYDVDGLTSAALLSGFLEAHGLSPTVRIPDRLVDGYGLNRGAVEAVAAAGATLLVLLDCGTADIEAVAHARKLGIEVAILDHHRPGSDLPDALLVNPNRPDDISGLGHLAAVGVTFLTVVATARAIRRRDTGTSAMPDLMSCLDLVALGTVCDMVPLTGLNRALVRRGLDILARGPRPGLAALARAARVTGTIGERHLGFALGPRLNAAGRIAHADVALRLLKAETEGGAVEDAQRLEHFNVERRAIEAEAVADAIGGLEAQAALPAGVVAISDEAHPGVIGLVASRLRERFDRPAFSITFASDEANAGDGAVGVGSGRSSGAFDIGAFVRAAVRDNVIIKGGGHPGAAGIRLRRERVAEFAARFADAAEMARSPDDHPRLAIDGLASASALGKPLLDAIHAAGPFGVGAPEPLLVLPGHVIERATVVGDEHVRLRLRGQDGGRVDGIAFRTRETALGQALLRGVGSAFHLAGSLAPDSRLQTAKVDFRVVDAAATSGRVD